MRAEQDAVAALVAHGLLNCVGVVACATATLRQRWPDLTEAEREGLLDAIARQAELMQGVLGDLARGLPSATVDAIDGQLAV